MSNTTGTPAGRLRQTVRGWLRYRGMMVLVLWQVPIQPVVEPDGSIGLVFGGGTSELVNLGCDGSVIDAEAVSYGLVAVEGERNLTDRLRIDGVAGAIVSGTQSHTGPFASAVLRLDWQYVGIGAGGAALPIFDEYNSGVAPLPAAHLRIGSAQRLHVRADIMPPSATVGQQMGRLALGYNAVDRTQASVQAGLAVVGSNERTAGAFGELSIPYGERVHLRFGGHYAPGYAYPISSLTLGVRYLLTSPARVQANEATPQRFD